MSSTDDFINDLINRLITSESGDGGSAANAKKLDWINDECTLDLGQQDLDQQQKHKPNADFVYRVQRLPKLTDRRLFLISSISTSSSTTTTKTSSDAPAAAAAAASGDEKNEDDRKKRVVAGLIECVCQQLPYQTCLNLVNERHQNLSWIGGTASSEKEKEHCTQTFSDIVRHVCHRLLPCRFITVGGGKDGGVRSSNTTTIEQCKVTSSPSAGGGDDVHSNLLIPEYIIETDGYFYALTSTAAGKNWVTLWDAAVISPHVLRDYSDRLLYVIYQLLSALVLCQNEAGFLLTDLRLDAIQINVDDFWCRLDLWRCLQYEAKNITLTAAAEDCCAERWSLGMWCDRWSRGESSNFEYLTILNAFAGRRSGDPYYHPIFPWVCDFTRDPLKKKTDSSVADTAAGWRDLTKTKFRLTKGDQQLEQTFAVVGHHHHHGPNSDRRGGIAEMGRSPSIFAGHHHRQHSIGGAAAATLSSLPPHHVTEFLSDIGYYAYKARRTGKSILCRHVRHRWVPEEYPSSLARLYDWTPDEAIPELYSDPELFSSIHPDLPDLEFPAWLSDDEGREDAARSNGGERFVFWHRAALESERVSEYLHSWIDLVFGYQLTGQAAVQAKNVQLHLMEKADRLANSGVVQLFTKPHPRRNTKAKPTSAASASVDEVMNPLYDMEHSQRAPAKRQEDTVHSAGNRTNDTTSLPVQTWRDMRACQLAEKTCPLVRQCLTNLAVLITELCHSEGFRQLPKYASFSQRLHVAKRIVFNGHNYTLPRCVRFAVELLLDPDLRSSSSTSENLDAATLCPGLILQPLISLIPFPYWMAPLYDCFRRIRSLETYHPVNGTAGIQHLMRESAEKRVREVAKLLPLVLPHMSAVGVDVLARLAKRALFADPCARVTAMWLIWNPLTQALGPAMTERHFLPCLLHLYDVDEPCSGKFLKLYHRTFLLQLSVRLGMRRFLDNFIQPLVEAAAGERDPLYCEDEDAYWKLVFSNQLDTGGDNNNNRHHLLLADDFPSPTYAIVRQSDDSSPIMSGDGEKKNVDDSDSIVQFPLEMTTEEGRCNNSSSFDLDSNTATTAVDRMSIVSSESGFSASGAGGGASSSLSFSTSKNDADFDQNEETETPPQNSNVQQQQRPIVSEVALESLLWLAHRLGPLLTARHVTSNLLRMLALCYSTDRLEPVSGASSSWYPVMGDAGADKVLGCLEEIAAIYGEHVILRHYFAYAGELIAQALKRLTPNMEMAALACVALIRRTFPYLTHEQLMENLKDHTFIDTLLFPLIRAASSIKVTFSSAATRTTLTWKLAECLFWLGVRVGSENVKTYLFVLVQRLFCTYDILYKIKTPNCDEVEELEQIPSAEKGLEWSDAAFVQLKATFTPVLASRMLDAFGTLCGRQYLQLSISNGDLLTKLCSGRAASSCKEYSDFPTDAASDQYLTAQGLGSTGYTAELDLACKRLKHSSRKLKGTWLAYWENELGRNPKETNFNFKHMKLQSFVGHSGSVRRICSLDNENSFFSAGQDKTVKLWSLRSTGDGAARTSCQFSYKCHRRPLLDVAFVESLRLIASVDGSVHIWDPFMGVPIREFELGDLTNDPYQSPPQQAHAAATIVAANSAPSTSILVAGTFSSIKFLDVRQAKWAQEFTLSFQRSSSNQSSSSCGPIRALCLDPSGADRWLAVGHGLGHVSTLDLRTGRLLGQMKLCETDIFAMVSFDKETFVVSPFDQPLHVVRARDCCAQFRMPGTSDAVTFAVPFYHELVCATQSNRLRFYTSVNANGAFTDSKLRGDVFSGSITSLHALPLNRLLLVGSITGNIELLC